VLAPGGRIRLVMPDLEEMCREYLGRREAGEHEKADFVILELLDQCVRQHAGGELKRYYRSLPGRANAQTMRYYIHERTGEDVDLAAIHTGQHEAWKDRIRVAWRSPAKLIAWLQWGYSHALSLLFPPAFRKQNISFTAIGERHMWVYDFQTVARLLRAVGFVDVEKLACGLTRIPDFPLVPLDIDEHGQPRKGRESMYIEARRPAA
jgi:hypothetical protein